MDRKEMKDVRSALGRKIEAQAEADAIKKAAINKSVERRERLERMSSGERVGYNRTLLVGIHGMLRELIEAPDKARVRSKVESDIDRQNGVEVEDRRISLRGLGRLGVTRVTSLYHADQDSGSYSLYWLMPSGKDEVSERIVYASMPRLEYEDDHIDRILAVEDQAETVYTICKWAGVEVEPVVVPLESDAAIA